MVMRKLQKSSSSARLTCLLLPGESAAQKLPFLFAVHDCDNDDYDDKDDDVADDDDDDHDDDDDDNVDFENVQYSCCQPT